MAKGLNRIALYELVNKARFKSAQQKALAAVEYRKTGKLVEIPAEPNFEPVVEKAVEKIETPKPPRPIEASVSKPGAVWGTKPKAVRLYPDRVELCFSWQVVIIGTLALIAMLMVFFRLGQIYSLKKTDAKKPLQTISVENIMPQPKVETASAAKNEQKPPKMVEPMGDNIIVIASHPLSSHLEPVKQYFAGFGIATEIIKKDNRFLLVTQERFNSVEKAGSDGFEMRKKIISIGANYKPPASSGFEPFGPKPFQDAYGMKVN
ncbi:MAG: hypothetical protein ABSE89_03930 [Sedimentisphaerales bacterium]